MDLWGLYSWRVTPIWKNKFLELLSYEEQNQVLWNDDALTTIRLRLKILNNINNTNNTQVSFLPSDVDQAKCHAIQNGCKA